jgi:hypothetical protein
LTAEEVVPSLVAAWNAGDPSLFAALFTEDAEYVTGSGTLARGRAAIAELLSSGGVGVAVEQPPSVRVYGDVASMLFRWRSEDSGRHGIVSLVVIERGSVWLIDRLQNTDGE